VGYATRVGEKINAYRLSAEKSEEKTHLLDLNINGRVWTRLMWLTIETADGLLCR
jgi:hypothetical protein